MNRKQSEEFNILNKNAKNFVDVNEKTQMKV